MTEAANRTQGDTLGPEQEPERGRQERMGNPPPARQGLARKPLQYLDAALQGAKLACGELA